MKYRKIVYGHFVIVIIVVIVIVIVFVIVVDVVIGGNFYVIYLCL